jgi:tetratricopeptide (TPR) repeat protein
LSGKVVIDDGTELTEAAIIQSICMGNIRNEGYTDSKGGFSIDLQNGASGAAVQDVEANSQSGPGMGSGGLYNSSGRRRDLRQCTLQAVLPGFTSQNIELASKVNETGNANVGTLVLHRMGKVEGLTISATSAAAPGKAKKEFQKGREDGAKAKWDSAQQHFAKAVEIYPKYAVAWNELGRVQLRNNDVAAATTSFQHAIEADASYVSPYGGLADIAVKAQQWKQLVDVTDKLLALNPVSFPAYWYDNALGHLFLKNLDDAEKSAMRGLSADPQHQVPRLEYLLGMILAQKRDYPGALTHVQNYLRLSPNAQDRETVEKQVAELQRLTTTSQVK